MKSNYKYSFEKLEAWKKAKVIVKSIYELTGKFPKEEIFGLTNQLRRAAVSVASNLAEGTTKDTDREKARYYQIAYGSAVEIINQLILAQDLAFISNQELEVEREIIEQLTYMINNLKKSYQNNMAKEPVEEYTNLQNQPQPQNPKPSQLSKPSPPPQLFFAHETAVIDDNCEIGQGTKIWHFSHIMSKSEIGQNCNIGQNVVVSPGVILGNNVKIQNNVSLYTGVICEDDVFLGPSMVFTNVINPRSAVNRKKEYQRTLVKKGASIGANATIVCGNDIGEYAFIGAGAVVTKAVPPFALLVGNPAKQKGWMSKYGQRLQFNEKGIAICPESQEEYKLVNGSIQFFKRK